MFRFGLFDANGLEAATAVNDACGNIKFPQLMFTAPGMYRYSMRELTASGDGWQCDGRIFGVTIMVTGDGKGGLTSFVTYDAGAIPTFVNRYNPPCDPCRPCNNCNYECQQRDGMKIWRNGSICR
jgi:pilin isopeptide linkage protein